MSRKTVAFIIMALACFLCDRAVEAQTRSERSQSPSSSSPRSSSGSPSSASSKSTVSKPAKIQSTVKPARFTKSNSIKSSKPSSVKPSSSRIKASSVKKSSSLTGASSLLKTRPTFTASPSIKTSSSSSPSPSSGTSSYDNRTAIPRSTTGTSTYPTSSSLRRESGTSSVKPYDDAFRSARKPFDSKALRSFSKGTGIKVEMTPAVPTAVSGSRPEFGFKDSSGIRRRMNDDTDSQDRRTLFRRTRIAPSDDPPSEPGSPGSEIDRTPPDDPPPGGGNGGGDGNGGSGNGDQPDDDDQGDDDDDDIKIIYCYCCGCPWWDCIWCGYWSPAYWSYWGYHPGYWDAYWQAGWYDIFNDFHQRYDFDVYYPSIYTPPALIVDPTSEAIAYLDRGAEYFRKGEYLEALHMFRLATLTDLNFAVSKFAYAHALFALGIYEYAAYEIRLGMYLMPEWPMVGGDLKLMYGDLKDYEDQVAALLAHLEAWPDDEDALLLLGYVAFFSGDLFAAEEAFQKIQYSPAYDTVYTASLFLQAIHEIKANLLAEDKGN